MESEPWGDHKAVCVELPYLQWGILELQPEDDLMCEDSL